MICPRCQHENPEDSTFCGKCGTQLTPSPEAACDFTQTLETSNKEFARGTVFANRYEIIEEIGTGGMGNVYRVEDKKLKEEIALKLIRPEIAKDRKTIDRFRNELKSARMIAHKNVCRMFDMGEFENTHFITMEYVKGEDLRSMIRMTGQFGIGTAVGIAKQLCEGLSEAHRLGVIHRDLKSSNIMIDRTGAARIMDFGIARSIKGNGLTGAGVMIGTPEYMSPEQIEGKDTDQRSDIYSFGVILYEMVTGRLPFMGDTLLSIAHKQKYEEPEDPKKFNLRLPEELSRLILRCLEKDKAGRFQAAADIRAELDRIEEGYTPTEGVSSERKPFTSKEITVKIQLKRLAFPTLALAAIALSIVFWPKKVLNLNPQQVAVAVFENKTGDSKLDHIGSLAAERIMQGLTQVGLFSVAPMYPPEALAAGAKGNDPIKALAKETKAGIIVHGDYFLQSETIQFHAWVRDVATGKNIVSLEPMSGPVTDPEAALESLRLRLMGGLAGVYDPMLNYIFSMMKAPPRFEAYREFVEGVEAYLRRDFQRSAEKFLLAGECDPNLHTALIYVSLSYGNQGRWAEADEIAQKIELSRSELSSGERLLVDWQRARLQGDSEGKLRIMRRLASSQTSWVWDFFVAEDAVHNNYPQEAIERLASYQVNNMAWKEMTPRYWRALTTARHLLGDHTLELKAARQGRKQFPDLLSILSYESRALAALGRVKELQKTFEESLTLPLQSGYSPGIIRLAAGRELRAHGYDVDSEQALKRALQWFESRPGPEKESEENRRGRAATMYLLERWEESKALYEALHVGFPEKVDYLGYLGAIAARKGEEKEAKVITKELEADERPYLFGNPTYWRARITAILSDKEGAVNLLREAIKQGYTFSELLPFEDFESLVDFPPFVQFMRPKG